MNATPSSAPESKKAPAEQMPAIQVLKPGKRRIIGDTKFGKDGCGY